MQRYTSSSEFLGGWARLICGRIATLYCREDLGQMAWYRERHHRPSSWIDLCTSPLDCEETVAWNWAGIMHNIPLRMQRMFAFLSALDVVRINTENQEDVLTVLRILARWNVESVSPIDLYPFWA